MVSRRSLVMLSALVMLAGACSRQRPVLRPPDHYDSYCSGHRIVRYTGMQSTLTSTDDTIQPGPTPSDAAIKTILRGATGAIGFWTADQPLYLPRTAKALGYPGEYVNVLSAAVPNLDVVTDSSTRPLYLTVRLPNGGTTTVTLRAFDHQNVCVEGGRSA